LSLSSVINRRARSHFPIIAQRERLADSLMRILTTLGLDRVPKPVQSLQEFIADFDAGKEAEHDDETPAPDGATGTESPEQSTAEQSPSGEPN
jgi:hypothetical protein